VSDDRRDDRELPDVHGRRREPEILLEELDVVHVAGTAVFDGDEDGERIRADNYKFLDSKR